MELLYDRILNGWYWHDYESECPRCSILYNTKDEAMTARFNCEIIWDYEE